jgi:tRNA(fMet)-specific endonuclease VapC
VKYLLAANTVIALLKTRSSVLTMLRKKAPGDVVLSAIVAYELYFGAYKSHHTSTNLALVGNLESQVLPFDQDDAAQSGRLRAVLASAGTPIGPYDLLIAGQALARGITLVTRNTREFARVAGLGVENWES